MKLTKILKEVISEIGDASKEPYPFELNRETEYTRIYNFSTISGFDYMVMVNSKFGDPILANVAFAVVDDNHWGSWNYEKETGEQDVYKILSTITAIVKEDLKNNPADILTFSPSKRKDKDQDPLDNVRTNLYVRYIKSEFPKSKVEADKYGDIVVYLKK
jgi:hypothetical protein